MQQTKLKIIGMTCSNCVRHVEKTLRALPGVQSVTVSLENGATVQHEGVTAEALIATVAKAGGYRAEVAA